MCSVQRPILIAFFGDSGKIPLNMKDAIPGAAMRLCLNEGLETQARLMETVIPFFPSPKRLPPLKAIFNSFASSLCQTNSFACENLPRREPQTMAPWAVILSHLFSIIMAVPIGQYDPSHSAAGTPGSKVILPSCLRSKVLCSANTSTRSMDADLV